MRKCVVKPHCLSGATRTKQKETPRQLLNLSFYQKHARIISYFQNKK